MATTVEDLKRAYQAVGDLVCGIGSDQWAASTPCTEWNVGDLIGHLTGVNRMFAALLDGENASSPGSDDSDDPVKAYQASAAALQQALGATGVLERSYPGPLGEATGAELLRLRLADLITHGWDLAQALQKSARLPEDLVEQALMFFQERFPTLPRAGRFADPKPATDDAPAIERLAALTGRQVGPKH